MDKLDKLKKEVLKKQEHIDRLNTKMTEAETAVINDPDNSQAALTATAAEMQVRAAEKAKERAQEAVNAENEILKGKVYEAHKAELQALEMEEAELKQRIERSAAGLLQQIKTWEGLAQNHGSLSIQYVIGAPELYNHERNRRGNVIELQQQLTGWLQNIRTRKHFEDMHK